MNVQNRPQGDTLPPDTLAKRIQWAILASIFLNVMGWSSIAGLAKRPMYTPPRPVEITRVIIDRKTGHKTEMKVKKEDIKKKVAVVRKPPPPKVRAVAFRQPPKPVVSPPPQEAHNRVLTDNSKGQIKSAEPPVLAGGNADAGKPIDHQGAGDAKENPPVVVKQPEKQPEPPPVVVKQPEKQPAPPPPVVVKQPEKQPEPPPVVQQPVVHKGPTKEAEAVDQVKPEIPDSLRHGDFKSFVRVKVAIDANGGATTILRTSSGNPEIDQRVLDALKKWKWKPALQNGVAVESVQLFKFEFIVE